ncbi:hypothetical protein NDA13_000422 [Ustilago tritici]|nr:hypothetical protein NDA13_000422 [Ustilago tritici]
MPSSFQSFCLQHFGFGTSCFPAISLQLLEWLAHLSSLGHPFHLAKHGLGALQSHHVDLGLNTSGFSCGRLEHALCGYKRLHGIGHSGAKLPITLPLLRQVLLAVGKMADLFPRDCLVLQAAFTLAFACFLRSGELVWDRGTNRATILTVSSIEWASDHVVLNLPASKTDPFRQGVCVVAWKWVASSAQLLVSGTSPTVTHLWCRSSALALLALILSLSLPLSSSSAVPSRLAASWHCSMPATLSIVAQPPGCCSMAPPPLTSSHSASGALTATTTTSTDWLRSAVLWSHQPSSPSVMAPWFPAAPPGEIQAWPDPGLLAPDPIKTALSCAGVSMTGLVGWEPPSSSPRLDPRNLFSVFSSWPCPCPI